jgi:hypothetical protein
LIRVLVDLEVDLGGSWWILKWILVEARPFYL